MKKPIVHYTHTSGQIQVGFPTVVLPKDHPSPLVSNTKLVVTSPVVKIGPPVNRKRGYPEKWFETENTKYVRVMA